MVVKNTPQVSPRHLGKAGKEIKSISRKIVLKHSRECHELNRALNYKITTSMKLTKKQQEYYSEVFARERERNESNINSKSKKNKEEQ